MVYGKGCKGNYQTLRKLALRTPFFPDWINKRSMIYIEHLCDFIEQLIRKEETGLFFPQNQELCVLRIWFSALPENTDIP